MTFQCPTDDGWKWSTALSTAFNSCNTELDNGLHSSCHCVQTGEVLYSGSILPALHGHMISYPAPPPPPPPQRQQQRHNYQ